MIKKNNPLNTFNCKSWNAPY